VFDEWSGVSGAPIASGPLSAGKIWDYATNSGAAASVGVATSSVVGAIVLAAVAVSSGAGAVSGATASTAGATVSSSSSTTTTGVATSTAAAALGGAGVATASAAPSSTAAAAFTIPAVATVAAIGNALVIRDKPFWPIAGLSISAGPISAVATPEPGAVASTTAGASVAGSLTSVFAAPGASVATSTTSGVSSGTFAAVASAAGAATAGATDRGIAAMSAGGSATASGVIAVTAEAVFSSHGGCIVGAFFPPVLVEEAEWIYVPCENRVSILPAELEPASDTTEILVLQERRGSVLLNDNRTIRVAEELRVVYIPGRQFTVNDVAQTPVGPEPRQRRIA
jgi:hypothetical protein